MIHLVKAEGPCAANAKASEIQTVQTQCTDGTARLQAIADRMDTFNRLLQGFNRLGWNLHNLDGSACLAVHRRWQTSQVLHSLGDAAAFLRRIGGSV